MWVWRNGSRASLRGWWEQSRAGSSPAIRTRMPSVVAGGRKLLAKPVPKQYMGEFDSLAGLLR